MALLVSYLMNTSFTCDCSLAVVGEYVDDIDEVPDPHDRPDYTEQHREQSGLLPLLGAGGQWHQSHNLLRVHVHHGRHPHSPPLRNQTHVPRSQGLQEGSL